MTKRPNRLKLSVVPPIRQVQRPLRAVRTSIIVFMVTACGSKQVIGTWACKRASNAEQVADSGSEDAAPKWAEFTFPWSTGFEGGDCEYFEGNGSCYTSGTGDAGGTASYEFVTAPVHSGRYAAAFTVVGDGSNTTDQSRCHRDGTLPEQAYYGAWYYLPAAANNMGNWNLIHFQGGSSPTDLPLQNIWDISLVNDDAGGLRLSVADYVHDSSIPPMSATPAVPIGAWFHIVVYLKRAVDETGAITVYQDDVTLLHAENLITDDTPYGQWYVGNFADHLEPAESTLYVDDVSVEPTL